MVKQPQAAHARGVWNSSRLTGVVLLAAWALYITVVTASNLSDLLASFGWEHWAFRSGNLAYIATATRIYVHVRVLNQVLLAIVIVWEAVAAALLWRAAASWLRTGLAIQQARLGLMMLTLVWFSFGIATELFVAYDRGVDESVYWVLAIAVMISLLVAERAAAVPSDALHAAAKATT